jgi:hypothetical protein
MFKKMITVAAVLILFESGCASKASDELVEKMCSHKLEVSGVLRGTVYEEEANRIKEEYKTKEDNLKAEMTRDLKGMDDVLAGRLKAIESGEDQDNADENENPETLKEQRVKAAKDDIEKKKKEITDQFEPLIAKLSPQRDFALNQAKSYTQKRQKEAAEAKETCIAQAQKAEVTEALATCRINANSVDAYDACKK